MQKPKSKSTLTLPTAVQRSSTYSSTSTDIAVSEIGLLHALCCMHEHACDMKGKDISWCHLSGDADVR